MDGKKFLFEKIFLPQKSPVEPWKSVLTIQPKTSRNFRKFFADSPETKKRIKISKNVFLL